MEKTLYMKGSPKTIAPYVIFSGDPWRVEVLKKYLDNIKHIGFFREYNTYTGTYKGLPITISSTGIGAPSAAIAMEEMYDCGMTIAVRMGTIMALNEDLLGQYVVPIGSVRGEATSDTYVEKGYPAVADLDLVASISKTIRAHGARVDNGINATFDGYYSQMKESRLSKHRQLEFESLFEQLVKNKVTGIDMESSCLLVLGRLMGVKTASVTLVTVLRNLQGMLEEDERLAKEDELCRLTLEAVYNYHQEQDQ